MFYLSDKNFKILGLKKYFLNKEFYFLNLIYLISKDKKKIYFILILVQIKKLF